LVFTLKVSYFNSPEFSEVFESLKQSGFSVQRTESLLLHRDDPLNLHTLVQVSDHSEPRPIVLPQAQYFTAQDVLPAPPRCAK
ncbi:hypothetical protein AK812_SmicGene48475, partial [Symbiodinium microadriaticum]